MRSNSDSSASRAGERVYLGLGGNQGDRSDHLRAGLRALDSEAGLAVVQVSRVYETEFVGPGRQEPYLNACAEICSSLGPDELLAVFHKIEADQGRRPDSHMLPRPLDLDILLFGKEIRTDPGLSLPHPRMRERAFVLVPLTEIAGREIFPDSGETVAEACAKLSIDQGRGVALCADLILWPNQPDPVQGG
jgi:2-amino-4-hydroxy-6-hydroxymethyldihydropteridine diphosphokinase